MRTLLWFRGKDLRLSDHAALTQARNDELIPVFVLDDYFFEPARARELPHRMQFLVESLGALKSSLEARGSRLLLVKGTSLELIPQLVVRFRCDRVLGLRWTEPFGRARDARVQRRLAVPFELREGETLAAPGSVRTVAGGAYHVYTPFAQAFRRVVHVQAPLPAPKRLPPLPRDIAFESAPLPTLAALGIERNARLPEAGEAAARARLKQFLNAAAENYADTRDRVDRPGTSRLSQDLKFGTLSARTVWRAIVRVLGDSKSGQVFTNQLIWREFAHGVLWDRPDVLRRPFRKDFEGFPWREDESGWRAWASGHTGYPVVDAAARQLLSEGFVHNRARMIAASFLTKHLLIHYRKGEAHYLKYLVDGDWAQNNLGWQWSAGSGCDAQPYFRVFNPVTQGERFDADGDYVRRWVPELAKLPARFIHAPWKAPARLLESLGVRLGRDYPEPIVEHALARERFLQIAHSHLSRQRKEVTRHD
ncbi:MAG TPA: deoxyribodipyrimidine photo-lyase [Polyangiaceae bacterium]|nr:deoxyribodipyrimidine photo-lyase [Polyangiaceae bacterium]